MGHELVVNMDNMDALTPKLTKLGVFHLKNAVPHRYLDIMGPIFCNAVRPILLRSDAWCPEASGYSAMDRRKKKFLYFLLKLVFCNTIRPILVRKELWSLELEETWLILFKKICKSMKKGYPKE